MRVDLHLHSTASDGLLAPGDLVSQAKAKGLEIIALTDHDTTSGLDEAHAAGIDCGIRVISGIELSSDLDGEEIHILGYLLDYHNQQLQELLEKIRLSRIQRINEMIKRLNTLGFDLIWEELAALGSKTSSLGRPHVARLMVKKGYASSVKEAFDHWLGFGCKAYVPRFKLHPKDAINIIHEALGLAFLAHPGLLPRNSLVSQVAAWGLDGLEVFHPQHRQEQVQGFLQQAEALALHISGGSDFHGGPEENFGYIELYQPWLMD